MQPSSLLVFDNSIHACTQKFTNQWTPLIH